MSPERYAGDAGMRQLREDEEWNSGAAQAERRAVRRDLISRLPYGRALDMEDLAYKLDAGSTDNKSIVMRAELIAEIRKNLPGGILITHAELELLRADAKADPKGQGTGSGIPGWPATR